MVITLITTRDKHVTLVACHDPAFNEINDGREGICELHCWNSYRPGSISDLRLECISEEHVQFASNCTLHARWYVIVRHSVKWALIIPIGQNQASELIGLSHYGEVAAERVSNCAPPRPLAITAGNE